MDKNGVLDILVLEDDLTRREWFYKTFKGCNVTCTKMVLPTLEQMKIENFDLIFLDRDLGNKKESGDDVAYEMMMQKLGESAAVVIHTVNPVGQKTMKEYLNKYHKNVYTIPYLELLKMKRKDFGIET